MDNKLVKSDKNRMIGGVCAGIANYVNIDPNLVRLAFALLTLASFTGPVLYVALMLLLPAQSAQDDPPMEWLQANVEDLSQTLTQTLNRIGAHPRGPVTAGIALIVLGLSVAASSGAWLTLGAVVIAIVYYLRCKSK